jgi:hypothetical protein
LILVPAICLLALALKYGNAALRVMMMFVDYHDQKMHADWKTLHIFFASILITGVLYERLLY